MKILTIAIPSYNSMDYMRNCIESLLPGGEDVEILIVDDGSKDETPAIADEYEAKYPGIIYFACDTPPVFHENQSWKPNC